MPAHIKRPKILFLTYGPSQKGSVLRYVELRFRRDMTDFEYVSAHNKPEYMRLISREKRQLIIAPHLPSDELGAHQFAKWINRKNKKAIVVAWTCRPPERMDLSTLAGVVVRRRKASAAMYEEIGEIISRFLVIPLRWAVVGAIRELQQKQRAKLERA